MPKRTFWLLTGIAIGAGSSMWAERRVRRGVEEAAARLRPDSLAATAARSTRLAAEAAGRSARAGARTASGRVRRAVTEGRGQMLRREEELWAGLASGPAGGRAGATAAAVPRGGP